MAALQKLFGPSCLLWFPGQGHPGMPHQGGSFQGVVLGTSDPRVHTACSLGCPDFSTGFSFVCLIAEPLGAQAVGNSLRATVLMLSSSWVTLGKLPNSSEPQLPQV